MLYQRFYRYLSLIVEMECPNTDSKKHTSSSLFLEVLLYLLTGQTKSMPNVFLLYSYSFLASYPRSAIMYNADGKENTSEDNVKGTYILLSGIFAVVTSAVRGTTIFPVVDVRCSLYPNTHPFVRL